MSKLMFALLIILSMKIFGLGLIKQVAHPLTIDDKNNYLNSKTNRSNYTADDRIVDNIINSNYQIESSTYTDRGIKIDYPKITNLNNDELEQKINQLISQDVLKVLDRVYGNNLDELDLSLKYEVTYQGSDMISIKYLGLGYVKGAAHPNNIIYTTTIDFNKQKVLALNEIIPIDDTFVIKFNNGKFLSVNSAALEYAIKDTKRDFNAERIKEYFSKDSAIYYVTANSLVVSNYELSHAIGDHVEVELDYQVVNK